VLVPLLADEGESRVLFTRRSSHLPHHQGRSRSRADATIPARSGPPRDRAREAHGRSASPRPTCSLGALDDIETRATRFVITPFVGVIPWPYELRPCPNEVDVIFTVPLRVLQAPESPPRALGLRRARRPDRHVSGRRPRHLGRDAADHAQPARRARRARLMRRLLVLVVVAAVVGVLLTRAEPFAPRATLDTPVELVGRATPIAVTAHDRGTGLARVEVRLVPEGGGAPVVLASESYPARADDWLFGGSGVSEATLARTVDAAAARLPEGRATLGSGSPTTRGWPASGAAPPSPARSRST
jgi:hypothetical protein